MYQKAITRAKQQKQQIPQLISRLIIFNKTQILDGIRTRWLFGKDVNGGKIGSYRSSDYKAFKVSINSLASGGVDLTLTGALGKRLTINQLNKGNYIIKSEDEKFEKIGKKYGFEQFNLDAKQTEELLDTLYYFAMEEFIKRVWLV